MCTKRQGLVMIKRQSTRRRDMSRKSLQGPNYRFCRIWYTRQPVHLQYSCSWSKAGYTTRFACKIKNYVDPRFFRYVWNSWDETCVDVGCCRARQMLKYSDEELAGKRGYDLIHPDDCHYYSAAHQERTSWYHHNTRTPAHWHGHGESGYSTVTRDNWFFDS